ncbi:MAG: hypothetical protein FJX76_05010 [Armatimonadetes bacterium]|nr:hypothetical protein [Armatimonadota bacterium]
MNLFSRYAIQGVFAGLGLGAMLLVGGVKAADIPSFDTVRTAKLEINNKKGVAAVITATANDDQSGRLTVADADGRAPHAVRALHADRTGDGA